MISEKLTYENFDGEMVTETAYFNLSRGELVKLDAILPGGFEEYMQGVVQRRNPSEMVKTMDKIIAAAYGVKTDDGLFVKPPERTMAFMASDAYYALLEVLCSEDGKVEKFMNGIMPKTPQDRKPSKDRLIVTNTKGNIVEINPAREIVEAQPVETEDERIERIVQERLAALNKSEMDVIASAVDNTY